MKKVIIFLVSGVILTLLIALLLKKKPSETPVVPTLDSTTKVQIFNATDSAVTVWITLGATPGCLQNANHIPFVVDTLGSLVGSFVLNAHDSTIAYAPDSLGYNGVISFNTQPINCATAEFPNGVNIYEFIINNGFQEGNPQETMDISCVAGVNCFIRVNMSGGNDWNASSRIPKVQSIANGDISHNSGRAGVFPYSCDSCITMYQPPVCDTIDTDKQKHNICNVQRNAKDSKGGLIKVIYMGQNQPL